MKAVGYLRELTAPGSLSLEQQQRAYLDECDRAGLEVGPTFTDVAEPTDALEATAEFRRMLRWLMLEGQHRFTTVVVPSIEVLGDTGRERAGRTLQVLALGLPLRFADGLEPDEAIVRAWTARATDEQRRGRAIEGMRKRALRGEVLGRPPYGYRVEARRLVPDPHEAPIVRRIFDLYLDRGQGVRRIAGRLNADGIRTRRGGAWSMVSVRDLLRNPVYTGTYRRLGVTVTGAHEPLVRKGDFDAVQRKMAQRRTSRGPQHRQTYLLSGIAYCGHCGNRLVGSRRRRTSGGTVIEQRYYQCESATNQSRCGYHTRHAEDLEAEVRDQVEAGEVRPPIFVDPAAASQTPLALGRRQAHGVTLQRDLDRMLDRRASGEWSAAQLRRHAAPLALAQLAAEERAAAGADGEGATEHDDGVTHRAEARRRLADSWERLEPLERRSLLLQVVREVVVTDDAVRVALVDEAEDE